MKKFENVGWYLPSHEKHLPEWMLKNNDRWEGRLAYQAKKIRKALELTPLDRRRTAVDIGAHCGLWSYYLASRFKELHAFEPIEEHRLCFRENVLAENVTLHPYALGDEDGRVGFHTEPSSSGDTYVSGKGDIEVRRLDSFGLSNVDLIKVDVEGWEWFALHGGEELLKSCKPTIVVEQKPNKAQKFGLEETYAVKYLQELGAKLITEISGDFFLLWPT